MRSGFRTILEAGGDVTVVGEAATGAEAVAAASALDPDIICMDVQMPDMDGLEATRRIVADPAVHSAVIVVTTFDRDDYLFAALEAGASGFLLKNAGAAELVSAVRVVAGGNALLAPEVTRRVIERFAAGGAGSGAGTAGSGAGTSGEGDVRRLSGARASELEPETPGEALTEREAEVLRLLARARSNAEIAQELYIGEATVKTHVSNILQKLGARDRVHAAVIALRHGLG
ncbi:response regulator [Microbacterium jepli]|uniref:response regulator n=1 Tax=unclassified Microbacterium TaxID=2609290 RepID=UPI00399FB7F0